MRDLLRSARGERLGLAEYDADFYAMVQSVDGPILKTERIQTFREPGSPSWEAFAKGCWEEALRIAAEPPLTPYLIWELNFLRYRADAGERIRVLDADLVGEFESEHGTVPELIVAGRQAVYEVRYDESGTPVGADKFVDPAVVEGCRTQVLALLDKAEPFDSFFAREVDGTRPPAIDVQ
ncbi:DUF6879 family protein [Micromonospora rubida]